MYLFSYLYIFIDIAMQSLSWENDFFFSTCHFVFIISSLIMLNNTVKCEFYVIKHVNSTQEWVTAERFNIFPRLISPVSCVLLLLTQFYHSWLRSSLLGYFYHCMGIYGHAIVTVNPSSHGKAVWCPSADWLISGNFTFSRMLLVCGLHVPPLYSCSTSFTAGAEPCETTRYQTCWAADRSSFWVSLK